MKNLLKISTLLLVAAVAFGQTQLSTTTFSAAVTGPFPASAGVPSRFVTVGSITGLTNQTLNATTSWLYADKELMCVVTVPTAATLPVQVIRGCGGTAVTDHTTTTPVYLVTAQAALLLQQNSAIPAGACVATNYFFLPMIHVPSGNVMDCLTLPGDSGTSWVARAAGSPVYAATDGYFYLPPSACNGTSANLTSATFTVTGASNQPVFNISSTSTGTNTHNYVCVISLPARIAALKGVAITDVTFMYGVQTTALGTQVNVLASGTLNGTLVFSKVTLPAAAASETASTVTPVRADSGTLTITPVVASFNVATTTAGAFYSAKFTPASPIPIQTDLTQLLFSVSLLNTATSATVTNTPGLIVHYTQSQL